MMTGLVFLADSLNIANRHINASASQHIQPDGNLAFAIDIDQLTNQSGQRTLMTRTFSPRAKGERTHTNTASSVIIEHETETGHLLVGNYGRSTFTTHHHITAHCRKNLETSLRSFGLTCTNTIIGRRTDSTILRRSLH